MTMSGEAVFDGRPFDLTQPLLDEVIDALETQGEPFEVKGYPLPKWGSAEGYALRGEFVSRLTSPLPKAALQEALHTGRGAFRAFKDVLKAYPLAQKAWHRYKKQRMASYVWQWYDALCDDWGLEHLSRVTDEDSGDLLKEDFVFEMLEAKALQNGEGEALRGWQAVERMVKTACETAQGMPKEVGSSFAKRWQKNSELEAASGEASGIVCKLPSCLDEGGKENDEAVGCVTWTAGDAVFLTSLYVAAEWRLLGIGGQLLNRAIEENSGKKVVSALPFMDGAAEALLKKALFERSECGIWMMA